MLHPCQLQEFDGVLLCHVVQGFQIRWLKLIFYTQVRASIDAEMVVFASLQLLLHGIRLHFFWVFPSRSPWMKMTKLFVLLPFPILMWRTSRQRIFTLLLYVMDALCHKSMNVNSRNAILCYNRLMFCGHKLVKINIPIRMAYRPAHVETKGDAYWGRLTTEMDGRSTVLASAAKTTSQWIRPF